MEKKAAVAAMGKTKRKRVSGFLKSVELKRRKKAEALRKLYRTTSSLDTS